jgi:hypothetical protein
VRFVAIVTCSEGRQLFGDLARNGIMVLTLQDTSLHTDYITNFLQKLMRSNTGARTTFKINGLKTDDKKIKYIKGGRLVFERDSIDNTYNFKFR